MLEYFLTTFDVVPLGLSFTLAIDMNIAVLIFKVSFNKEANLDKLLWVKLGEK